MPESAPCLTPPPSHRRTHCLYALSPPRISPLHPSSLPIPAQPPVGSPHTAVFFSTHGPKFQQEMPLGWSGPHGRSEQNLTAPPASRPTAQEAGLPVGSVGWIPSHRTPALLCVLTLWGSPNSSAVCCRADCPPELLPLNPLQSAPGICPRHWWEGAREEALTLTFCLHRVEHSRAFWLLPWTWPGLCGPPVLPVGLSCPISA